MRFIDTHTHLYDEAYGGIHGQDQAVRRAIDAGVDMMIVPDTCSRDRAGVMSLCRRWPHNTRPCIGLHPEEVGNDWKEALAQTIADAGSHHCSGAEASDNRKIVAIGEVGMDLHYGKDFENQQEEVFRAQLDLALELHLPVIVHSRDALEQTFRILEDYKGRGLTGVFHAFSSSLETFERLDGYGDWMVGIGGVLTFKNASIARTAANIPLERIILETDSPYLTPTPHRGERNESSYIPLIAEFLAGVKNTDIDEIAETTTRNAVKLFNI